jgi:arylsulfatase A-like enzyme/tetratricopeptide (TPR) repeat protein
LTPVGSEEQRRVPVRRKTLAVALACAAVVIAAVSWILVRRSQGGSGAPARDIILVTIDTLRADSVGYAGNTRVRTPFLDSLAGRGLEFTNAHAHNVITLPSHTNILTGLYPFQHGVRENAGFKLDPKYETVAAMLHRGGYVSGAFIGAFPLDARFGLNRGFDTYDDNYGKGQAAVDFAEPERRAEAVLAAATKWWNGHAGEKRFMWVHLYDPHAPYAPPEPFLSSFRGNEYLGEISYVDDELSKAIGPIVAAEPDLLIVVTADHGEALGDHGEATHGLFAYESTLKVPLLVAGHGTGHRKVNEFVRHVDIVPTILEAAGLPKPAALPGSSLLHDVGTRDSYFESLSASLNRGWAPLTGIIHDGLKYIDLPLAELYDLPRDPRELENLRELRRRDVEAARRLLAPMQVPPSSRAAVSSEEIARLRSLGYVSGNASPREHYTEADDPKKLIGLDSKMHAAVDAFERGNPVRALALAREVVAARSDMDAGRELLAFMLQQNDQIAEAMEQLKILVSKPNAADSDRVHLALLLSETGNPKGAIDLLTPRAGSNDPDLLNALGVALSDSGREAEARSQFDRVLAIDANDAPALQNLGILALKAGNVSVAESRLTRSLELNPKLPLAWNTLGVLYAQKGDFEHAVDSWKRAVACDPRQYDALLNIGIVASKAGNAAEARAALERFVRTAPKSHYAADIAEAQRTLAQLR